MYIEDFGERFNEPILYHSLTCESQMLTYNVIDHLAWIPGAIDRVNKALACAFSASVELPYLTTNSVCFTPSVEFKKLVKRHAKNIEEMVDAICILISTVKTVIESSFSCDDIYHGQKLFNNWDYLIEKIRHLLNDLDNSEKIKLV